jgi:hypothetical protein
MDLSENISISEEGFANKGVSFADERVAGLDLVPRRGLVGGFLKTSFLLANLESRSVRFSSSTPAWLPLLPVLLEEYDAGCLKPDFSGGDFVSGGSPDGLMKTESFASSRDIKSEESNNKPPR